MNYLIKKEKLKSGRYQLGIYLKNDDNYIDYIFCNENELNIANEWALNRIKEFQNEK